MKKSASRLRAVLAESLQAHLPGLSEKHAEKLQKTVASAAKKIAKKFAKLLAKQSKTSQAADVKIAPPVPRQAARRVGPPAARLATPKKAGAAALSS